MAEQNVTISTFKTAKSSASAPSFVVDTSELKELAKRLRAGAPAVAKSLRARMHGIGDIVADAARDEASWSSRIPGSIRVRVSGFNVKVVGNATGLAPDAPPYENKGVTGSFRHPVFGNVAVWVDQKARPFLAPASASTAAIVEAQALAVIDDTLKAVGL